MAISYKSLLHDRERVFAIAIDRYGEGILEGVLYQGDQHTGIRFSGYYGLVWYMEQYFARLQYPRSVMDKREFRGSKNEEMKEIPVEDVRRQGMIGTYQIRVTQRQNASWQGVLMREGKDVYHFNSFMNLVGYMEADLSGSPMQMKEWEKKEGRERLERYLQVVMNCLDVVKILPDTLIYRFQNNGRSQTFMVRPMFYEHEACQGMVYWKEWKRQTSFRSFLELVHIMGTAVRDGED